MKAEEIMNLQVTCNNQFAISADDVNGPADDMNGEGEVEHDIQYITPKIQSFDQTGALVIYFGQGIEYN